MSHVLRVALVSAVVGTAAPAWACHRGAHGHVGAGHAAIDLRFLELFAIGLRVHSHARPCPEVVVQPAPPVEPSVVYHYAAPQPQIVYVPTPPPVVFAPTPPPVVVAAPAPVVPPAPVVAAAAVAAPRAEGPALLAVKYLPGASGTFTSGETVGLTGIAPIHSVGLEIRLSRWFALRSDLELRRASRSYDLIGGKLWLAPPHWGLRPYASASLSGSELNNRFSLGVVGAAGLNLTFGKHFFLEAEGRYRVAPGDCCREVPQVTGLVGGGVAFF